MNKVNLCWVLSEGRKGHEIQSMTLAQHIAKNICLHTFTLQQPWDSFAPRIIPRFQNGFTWHHKKPDFHHAPSVIVSTGRKAAALGKYITQRYRKKLTSIKHIQILNPRDNADNYDLLLIPEHDKKQGSNIVTFSGSLHPFSPQWFKQEAASPLNHNNSIAVFIGNPPNQYFKKHFKTELQKIRRLYPDASICFCGSPRLSDISTRQIKTLTAPKDTYWFNHNDGPNPYHKLLHQAKHLFVTADSINMMNECAGSNASVTLLAQNFIKNPKHKRFFTSMTHRWQDLEQHSDKPIVPIPYALNEIIENDKFQKLLNSPSSFNEG